MLGNFLKRSLELSLYWQGVNSGNYWCLFFVVVHLGTPFQNRLHIGMSLGAGPPPAGVLGAPKGGSLKGELGQQQSWHQAPLPLPDAEDSTSLFHPCPPH